MASIVQTSDGLVAQAIKLPATGTTINIASAAGSAASAAVLPVGLYRVSTTIAATICAGATAAATDMPMAANTVEYFYFDGTAKLAAYCAATGGTISATPAA